GRKCRLPKHYSMTLIRPRRVLQRARVCLQSTLRRPSRHSRRRRLLGSTRSRICCSSWIKSTRMLMGRVISGIPCMPCLCTAGRRQSLATTGRILGITIGSGRRSGGSSLTMHRFPWLMLRKYSGKCRRLARNSITPITSYMSGRVSLARLLI
ncbi:hypothetical protein LPJ73_000312, partial [Coemansia sp. RSA 2703]